MSGWHATDASLDKIYHFIIIYDATTKKEISRTLVSDSQRNDVANAYPGIYDAVNSGFKLTTDFTSKMAGDSVQVISRYSNSASGQGSYVDYWFTPKSFNSNVANLDTFKISGTNLVISGWHASDLSAGKDNHYIIIYDQTKHIEIKRMLVPSSKRSDVGKVYGNVYNSNNSGFSITTALTESMIGDNIQIISRYSDSINGEGNYVDYWFGEKTFSTNEGRIDDVKRVGTSLSVSGWHVADESIDKPYNYLIIWDETTGREIGRYQVEALARADVEAYLPNAYNSKLSGFSLNIPQINVPKGHTIKIVSRYSDQKNGEGNFVDFWSNEILV